MKAFIAKFVRAVRNQSDRESITQNIVCYAACLVLIAICIAGIITQPDRGVPIAVFIFLLAFYLPAVIYWQVTSVVTKQENQDKLDDLARRKAAYRAQLDLDPTLSAADKARMEKGYFMADELVWT